MFGTAPRDIVRDSISRPLESAQFRLLSGAGSYVVSQVNVTTAKSVPIRERDINTDGYAC